mmetsp:Transcript_102624/g.313857  ORF Transcript_102624/g.313857 Transcript_102624/m.313857 type:complete len:202 (-) Transcript_102624:955-1560(-)
MAHPSNGCVCALPKSAIRCGQLRAPSAQAPASAAVAAASLQRGRDCIKLALAPAHRFGHVGLLAHQGPLLVGQGLDDLLQLRHLVGQFRRGRTPDRPRADCGPPAGVDRRDHVVHALADDVDLPVHAFDHVLERKEMVHAQRVLRASEAMHEFVNGELPSAVDVEHVEQADELARLHLDADLVQFSKNRLVLCPLNELCAV